MHENAWILYIIYIISRVGRGRVPRPGTGRDPGPFCSGRGDGAGTKFDPGSGIGDGEKRNPRLPDLLEFHVIQTNYLIKILFNQCIYVFVICISCVSIQLDSHFMNRIIRFQNNSYKYWIWFITFWIESNFNFTILRSFTENMYAWNRVPPTERLIYDKLFPWGGRWTGASCALNLVTKTGKKRPNFSKFF